MTDRGAKVDRFWGTLRNRDKIIADAVIQTEQHGLDDVVDMLCHSLDIPRPIVLKKHRNEFLQFRRTRFSPTDFIEKIGFAFFEVEELRDRKKNDAESPASKRLSSD